MGLGSVMRLSMLFSAVDGLTGPVRKMLGSVQDLEKMGGRGKALVQLGDQVSWAGSHVSGAAATMRAGVSAVLSPIMDVEDSLAELQTVWTPTTGTMVESLDRAKAAAVEWSNSHKASTSDFIRSSYQMASAGLNEEQALVGTKVALTLATAALGDNVEAANLLGQVYNTLGDKAKPVGDEMGRMGDVLARTQQLYQIANLGQLNAGLQYAIPVSQQARISFEQMNAAIGQLNSSGLQGSMAGTAYSSMLTRLADASGDLGFQLVKTADGGLDLEGTLTSIRNIYGPLSRQTAEVQANFKKAFGDDGVRAVGLLTENLASYKSGLVELNNAQGAAAKGAAAIESTSSATWKKLKNQLQNAALPLGEALLPLLEQVAPVLTEIIGAVADFIKHNPELAKLGATAFLIGTGVGTIMGPVLSVAGGLASMAGHGMEAAEWVGRKLLGSLKGGAGTLSKVGSAASGAGKGFLGMARSVIKAGLAFMATPIGWIVAGVAAVGGLVAWAIADWDGFKEFWVDLWDSVVGTLKDAWDWIEGTVKDIGGAVNAVTDLMPQLSGPADESARGLVSDYFAGRTPAQQMAAAAPTPTEPDVLSRYRSAVPETPRGAVGGAVERYLPSHRKEGVGPEDDALSRFRAMGGMGTDGAAGETADLLDRLRKMGAELDQPAGADYPELDPRRQQAQDTGDVPLAYRDPFLAIPDRREVRDSKPTGPTVTIGSINVTASKDVDEKRLVQQVIEQLTIQMRAQGVSP